MKRLLIALLVISVILLSVSCHWDVWGSTVVEYGKGTGTISTTLSFTGEAPNYVSATRATYSDKIVITWNKVTGADFYEIYRKMDDDTSTWKKLPTNAVDTTSYEDTDVTAGITYMYKVRARSFSNLYVDSEISETVYGNILSAPIDFTVAQGESSKQIDISWSTVENVKGYKIYWSTTGYGGTWNVAIPDGMQSVDYTYSSNMSTSAFVPERQYRGTSIYFYIVSISSSGVESNPSVQRIGYTFVEGAPSAPKNFTASRGESTSEITLSWDSMHPGNNVNENYAWNIYRSANGDSETLIYSSEEDGELPDEADGRMSYTDKTSLKAGVEYTYKIIAIGEVTQDDGSTIKANGKPSSARGFLLSPPTEIVSMNTTDNGFEFVFKDALGAEENPDWSYSVLGRASDSDSWTLLSDYQLISVNSSGEYKITTVYNANGTDEEKFEYFTVRTNASVGKWSRRYDEVVNKKGFYVARPQSPESFNASDNYVFSGVSATGAGLYPVSLTLSSSTTAVTFDVRIWTGEVKSAQAAGYTELKDLIPERYDSNTYILKLSTTTGIGTKYYFAVRGKDSLGREGDWSKIDSGYSAITGNLLIKYMSIYCFKPWEHIDTKYLTKDYYPYSYDINTKWKNSKIYAKIKQAGTGSLSDGITEESYFNNGTIKYSAVVQGVGGRVSFNYNNFGEVEYMSTSGSYTMVVSMSGDGTATGSLTIKGWYPAKIGMDNISVKSQAFSGTYTVTQSNGLGAEEVNPNQE